MAKWLKIWGCLVAYISLTVAAEFIPKLHGEIEITLQSLIVIVLLGWAVDLRTKIEQPRSKNLIQYACVGHALWIAITDGRMRYTESFARGEALTFAALCAVIWYFSKNRGNTWKKSV